MTAEVAREFHALTSHAPGRPSPGGSMDPRNRPAPDKRYRGVDTIDLPTEWPAVDLAMADVLSGTVMPQPPADRADLARLLFLAAGVSRPWPARAFRTYPSAGALYPNEVYVANQHGLYHYEPLTHRLDVLRTEDVRGHLGRAAADAEIARAPLTWL